MFAFEIADLANFRGLIAERLGLHFDESKNEFLADVLQRRAKEKDAKVYLASLAAQLMPDEMGELAKELTVTETYFFRHIEQFNAFREVALPACLLARASSRQIRILSAGCSSGEEAYTLAILLREKALDSTWNFSVHAVDANSAMLEKARAARYTPWSLRETPADIQRRWFLAEGREFILERSLRDVVTFTEGNLARDDANLLPPGTYDVVFCRNMLMYFTVENAQKLVARIRRALAPDGYLFLGHAETLRGLSQDFHLRHTHGTFYYQRKEGEQKIEVDLGGELNALSPLSSPAQDFNDSWMRTIERASSRIQTLTASAPLLEPAFVSAAPALGGGVGLNMALDLLQQERFAEALQLLGPQDAATDLEVLLLRAVLLAHAGQTPAAEQVCAQLLEQDELSSGAHYVLALCREGRGDKPGALDHYQAAVYLDPTFAMPRLHLGLMARRAGDRDTAQRELSQAIVLLQREDSSRLLLFGGGFNREALMGLCRAELVAVREKV